MRPLHEEVRAHHGADDHPKATDSPSEGQRRVVERGFLEGACQLVVADGVRFCGRVRVRVCIREVEVEAVNFVVVVEVREEVLLLDFLDVVEVVALDHEARVAHVRVFLHEAFPPLVVRGRWRV